jgi:hypothetical protein
MCCGTFVLNSQINCECGEHESGITYFQVGTDQECCSGDAGENGAITYYEQSEGGTWKAVKNELITGAQAQSNCCESA